MTSNSTEVFFGHNNGMCIGTAGSLPTDAELPPVGNLEVVQASRMKEWSITSGIEDLRITLKAHYHLLRPMYADSDFFLGLASARRSLSQRKARFSADAGA